MKVSDITTTEVRDYVRPEGDTGDISMDVLLDAAISYVKSYTGLDSEGLDKYDDISNAVMVLCSDMYDKRQMTVENDKINRVVQSILDMHSINLL